MELTKATSMTSPDRKPDRVGSVIAAVASVISIYLAHLALPHVSLGLLVVPGIILGAVLAIAIRRPRGTR